MRFVSGFGLGASSFHLGVDTFVQLCGPSLHTCGRVGRGAVRHGKTDLQMLQSVIDFEITHNACVLQHTAMRCLNLKTNRKPGLALIRCKLMRHVPTKMSIRAA